MRIEGYLFLPYGGQYRFGFDAYEEGPHIKVNEVQESKRMYDHFWDVMMRSRPTLHELTEDSIRVQHIRKEWERAIINFFKTSFEKISESKNCIIRKQFDKIYVEFVHIA